MSDDVRQEIRFPILRAPNTDEDDDVYVAFMNIPATVKLDDFVIFVEFDEDDEDDDRRVRGVLKFAPKFKRDDKDSNRRLHRGDD